MVDESTQSQRLARQQRLASRLARHREIETEMDGLGEGELLRWLTGSSLLDQGCAALTVPRLGAKVFVKLLPLTALELQSAHLHSTANLFGLPPHYHYRLGSCGLGAWRELSVHEITNEWVLSGQCSLFPLLHGWRSLPLVSGAFDDKLSMAPWGANPAIQRRVTAVRAATSSVVLILEYIPLTLAQWLRDRPSQAFERMADVLEIETALLDLLSFSNSHGLLHMDAHFENILTDGEQFFLSDHGLAISSAFQLDIEERQFFERHENFDRCTAVTSFVHALVSRYDSRQDWRRALRELSEGTHPRMQEVPASVCSYLGSRGPLALAVGAFYRRLTTSLVTEYPAATLQRLLEQG